MIALSDVARDVAEHLDRLKKNNQRVIEASINQPIDAYAKRHSIVLQRERHHPSFDQHDRRRIDFVRFNSKGEIDFAIEAKLLPEAPVSARRAGHDFIKDLVRLGMLVASNGNSYFLLATPQFHDSLSNHTSWTPIYRHFLPDNQSFVILRDLSAYYGLFWHVQKNLSFQPLSNLRIEKVAHERASNYTVDVWRVQRYGTDRFSFSRTAVWKKDTFKISQRFSIKCGKCHYEPLYRISATELQKIQDGKAAINSVSLRPGIRNRTMRVSGAPKWICPRCDACALGGDAASAPLIIASDGTVGTIHDLAPTLRLRA